MDANSQRGRKESSFTIIHTIGIGVSKEDPVGTFTPSLGPTLGDFLCIPTPNAGQLNPPFHTFAEFRLIVNRIVVRQSTDWLAANAQFSPNVCFILMKFLGKMY